MAVVRSSAGVVHDSNTTGGSSTPVPTAVIGGTLPVSRSTTSPSPTSVGADVGTSSRSLPAHRNMGGMGVFRIGRRSEDTTDESSAVRGVQDTRDAFAHSEAIVCEPFFSLSLQVSIVYAKPAPRKVK